MYKSGRAKIDSQPTTYILCALSYKRDCTSCAGGCTTEREKKATTGQITFRKEQFLGSELASGRRGTATLHLTSCLVPVTILK